MSNTITIKGNGALDIAAREKALKKINTLNTDELKKLEQMCTANGRSMLKESWSLIKGFI